MEKKVVGLVILLLAVTFLSIGIAQLETVDYGSIIDTIATVP